MLAPLISTSDLDDVLSLPIVVLFKHSSACAISGLAMREMYRLAQERPDLPVHLVDVRAARALSAEVADRLGIRHESPQVIVLRDGEPVWHGSHFQVTADRVQRATDDDR